MMIFHTLIGHQLALVAQIELSKLTLQERTNDRGNP